MRKAATVSLEGDRATAKIGARSTTLCSYGSRSRARSRKHAQPHSFVSRHTGTAETDIPWVHPVRMPMP